MRSQESDVYWLQLDDLNENSDGNIILTDARKIPYYGKARNRGREDWTFTVVWKGHKVGIFDEWSEAHSSVTNISGNGFQNAKGWLSALDKFLTRHPDGYPAQRAVTFFPAHLTGADLSSTASVQSQSPSLPVTPPHTPPQGQRRDALSSETLSLSSISQEWSQPRSNTPGTDSDFEVSLMLTTDSLTSLSTGSTWRSTQKHPVGRQSNDLFAVKDLHSPGTTVYVDRSVKKSVLMVKTVLNGSSRNRAKRAV
ncbi:hypothetical protein BDP27DRAFT_1427894 [Rhodocollybia butyracea]|uniref:Ribonuclease H1 N-terminal domain-containing protein n=1 Tax=Rhodocollybia butyracea TaxID=206335 RepID=A0A9P5PEQ2_9AGAR|nr:hypothetical protein BDP27DRAFT_1427894 [Rhodocollybia butyracea]